MYIHVCTCTYICTHIAPVPIGCIHPYVVWHSTSHTMWDLAKGSKGVQMGSYGVKPWGYPHLMTCHGS